jgi:hypothetical protein
MKKIDIKDRISMKNKETLDESQINESEGMHKEFQDIRASGENLGAHSLHELYSFQIYHKSL